MLTYSWTFTFGGLDRAKNDEGQYEYGTHLLNTLFNIKRSHVEGKTKYKKTLILKQQKKSLGLSRKKCQYKPLAYILIQILKGKSTDVIRTTGRIVIHKDTF